jgi:2-hydroxy-3-keto-5-methylthiopentenyl-1-phosphate phosphatase
MIRKFLALQATTSTIASQSVLNATMAFYATIAAAAMSFEDIYESYEDIYENVSLPAILIGATKEQYQSMVAATVRANVAISKGTQPLMNAYFEGASDEEAIDMAQEMSEAISETFPFSLIFSITEKVESMVS